MLFLKGLPMEMNKNMKCLKSLIRIIPLAGGILLASCGQQQEQQQAPPPEPVTTEVPEKDSVQLAVEQVYMEVMEIHDRSMEQMSEIQRLSRQLNDSIEHTGVNPMEQEETINRYRNHLKELTDADQAMRQWMREFSKGGEDFSKEEKLEYLKKEKEKIEAVDRSVSEAIIGAREALR